MDPISLEATISKLNHSVDCWRSWLDFWTALVVIGLIVEYGKEIIEISRHRPFEWKKLNLLIGAVLVTGGVAGELFVQYLSATDENLLRNTNEQLIHSLQTAAADARRDIELARKETALANKAAALANERAADATKGAAFALSQAAKLGVSQQNLHNYVAKQERENNQATVELKKSTLQLNKARDDALAAADASQKVLASISAELKEERDVRKKFANMVEDRQITSIQAGELVAALKNFKGQEFTVTTFWDLKEPVAFANKLYAVLSAAGWKYDDSGQKGFLLGGMSGIQVFAHPEASKKSQQAGAALVSALRKHGFEAVQRAINSPGHPDERIRINVGTKN